MTLKLARRSLLQTASLGVLGAATWPVPRAAQAASATKLNATRRILEVNGKPAPVFGLVRANGATGITLDPGERFVVDLVNQIDEDTIVHWHGQTPPPAQDGVAITGMEAVIAAKTTRAYDFAARPGTHWMHSHQGMQEMQLMSAPLIVRTQADIRRDEQEVVMLLHDFTFRAPEEVLASLNASMGGMAMPAPASPTMPGMAAMPGMAMGPAKPDAGGMKMGDGDKPDLNDFDFDAYLANDRTLSDPEIIRTERGGKVLLRVINAAASTSFWLDLGEIDGSVIAVDGSPVTPVAGRRFPISEAQRLDILLEVKAGSVVPIIAQRVGDRARTGIILAAPGAAIGKLSVMADQAVGGTDLSLEQRLTALEPLAARPVDVRLKIALGGTMSPYAWTINGRNWADRVPLQVTKGQRAVLDFVNETSMAHPMHLHGHAFQVIGLNGKALAGAVRDVIQVPPKGSASVAFDADNPGRWLIHCHNMLHMETGMITELVYKA